MNRSTLKRLLVVTIILLLQGVAHGAMAAATGGCHCFRDRTYDPAQKFAADVYILATSFNSLLAKAYDISKKQVVLLKMQGGINQDDLLIGLRTAKVTGAELQEFLILRDGKYSWQEILSSEKIVKKTKNDTLLEGIRNGMPEAYAAQKAADLLLSDFFSLPLEEVNKLRASGLSEKEMALVFILAHSKDKKPDELSALYQKEGKSWSEIADSLGIEPITAGKLILAYPAKNLQAIKLQ